jgi:hypothetical protein
VSPRRMRGEKAACRRAVRWVWAFGVWELVGLTLQRSGAQRHQVTPEAGYRGHALARGVVGPRWGQGDSDYQGRGGES